MAKGIIKRLLVAVIPLVLNEATQYFKNKKSIKTMRKMNMVK